MKIKKAAVKEGLKKEPEVYGYKLADEWVVFDSLKEAIEDAIEAIGKGRIYMFQPKYMGTFGLKPYLIKDNDDEKA